MSYDVIGDLHGNADKLEALLARMGYVHRHGPGSAGAWRHPTRTAIFVGDFVDRGPHQRRTVELARAMVEDGAALAVMGNREFNAIARYLPDPEYDGEHLRARRGELGARNRHQHQSFLEEYESDPLAHRDCIDWFLTLPLWLDLPGLRVVHACWHDGYMAELEPRLAPGRRLTPALVRDASRYGSTAFRTVEGLTKGLEVALPACARTHPPTDKPVFFGHYWLTGEPAPLDETVACVDHSAGKDGPLVAYRRDGEQRLVGRNFWRTG